MIHQGSHGSEKLIVLDPDIKKTIRPESGNTDPGAL
jgi:hypothetical protein